MKRAVHEVSAPPEPSIDAAVLATLAYADVFGWPLTATEIHETLPLAADLDDVHRALSSPTVKRVVSQHDDLYVLWGRADLAAQRRRREMISAGLWPYALRYARVIAELPFVRFVGVSGSLAVNAADENADIDLFIVTADGRLWTARALVIGVVRAAAIGSGRRPQVCPNYLVTESNLVLAVRDVFTAHELVQLVPLFGVETFTRLVAQNDWVRDHLPNHAAARRAVSEPPWPIVRRAVEPLLGHRWLDGVERWERQRKVPRLTPPVATIDVAFDETACKGHVDGHRQRILDAYAQRLDRLSAES